MKILPISNIYSLFLYNSEKRIIKKIIIQKTVNLKNYNSPLFGSAIICYINKNQDRLIFAINISIDNVYV